MSEIDMDKKYAAITFFERTTFERDCRRLRDLMRTAGKRREVEALEHQLACVWLPHAWERTSCFFDDGMVVHLIDGKHLKFGHKRDSALKGLRVF